MHTLQSYQVAEPGQVNTIHILNSGEIISSLEDYLKFEDRFSWVNRSFIIAKMLELRKLTDTRKKSIIAIYEEGHLIREYVNVEETFRPLSFC
jgi:hypothetical protein